MSEGAGKPVGYGVILAIAAVVTVGFGALLGLYGKQLGISGAMRVIVIVFFAFIVGRVVRTVRMANRKP